MPKMREKLDYARKVVDTQLDILLPLPDTLDKRVVEAMRYSAISAGKAVRPFLVLTIANMLNVPETQAIRVATAVEMVHTYSLIHDDLPAMDNDTMRRGKPTSHIQFDEATAILAGDALLTYAFEILADKMTHPNAAIRCKLIEEMAKAVGHKGMIGGQMIDLIGEKTPLSLYEVEQMQSMKTGAPLRFACIASAILAKAPTETFNALITYADAVGLIFQITDDILDVEGKSEIVGKTLGKDAKSHKSTFVSILGVEESRQMAKDLAAKAKDALKKFGVQAELLNSAIDFILTRNR